MNTDLATLVEFFQISVGLENLGKFRCRRLLLLGFGLKAPLNERPDRTSYRRDLPLSATPIVNDRQPLVGDADLERFEVTTDGVGVNVRVDVGIGKAEDLPFPWWNLPCP